MRDIASIALTGLPNCLRGPGMLRADNADTLPAAVASVVLAITSVCQRQRKAADPPTPSSICQPVVTWYGVHGAWW